MNRFLPLLLSAGCALALLAPREATAQRNGISAQEAIDLVSAQFGPKAVQWIAELRGRSGVPQPADWELLSYDERMPRLLYRFWATAGRVVDGGPDEERYPLDIPVGYFGMNQVVVDSVAAFTIAEGEARKARMAFDSCDYLLRVREYSTEPIWRLELFDARQQIVGKIYISATSGTVRRTVWIYRDERALSTGRPRIVDSMAPSQMGVGPDITSAPAPDPDSFLNGPRPGESTGIVQMRPPISGPEPGQQSGIAQMPPRPAPRFQEDTIPAPPVPNAQTAPQPYRPVDPSGNVVDNSIPDPPAAGGEGSTGMRDLREAPAQPDPTRPPIEVPTTGSGSSERIPPPPIPR